MGLGEGGWGGEAGSRLVERASVEAVCMILKAPLDGGMPHGERHSLPGPHALGQAGGPSPACVPSTKPSSCVWMTQPEWVATGVL